MRILTGRPLVLMASCLLHLALAISLTACGTKAKAQTLPDGPPLAVPVAPVHEIVIEQIAEAPPQEPEVIPEPEKPAAQPRTTRTQTRPQPAPKPEATPPATQPAAAAPQPAAPEPQVIRAAPAAAAGDEKKARDLLAKASKDLSNVDYKKLSKDGQAQYDQSKRFNEEAMQAINQRNFVYALTLAEKAATLAAELVR